LSIIAREREIIIKKLKEKELLEEEVGLLFTTNKRRNYKLRDKENSC
jgi:hypothetical protein